MEKPVTKQIS